MTKLKQICAVIKLNTLLQLSNPAVQVIMILIPLIMAPFMMPSARAQLMMQGYHHVNGSEQVMPGLAILFSFLSVQLIIQMFFDEIQWNTWDRQQVSATSLNEIIIGKVLVAYFIQLVQLIAIILISNVLFDFHINGSWGALILIIMIFALLLTCLGILLVGWINIENLALTLSNLLGMLMAGLGGAISPTNTFPHWAQTLALIDPAYWALTAIKKICLDHGNFDMIKNNIIILAIIIFIFSFLAFIGFHYKPLRRGNN
ncbi:ABC transporter permease [Bombilactobacillus bombi]|uniref:ABC transporter permease n=1 Tax=Bombilactobacillus bombi TaxID=1303590 RepID=UPI0015E5A522|nr:ABC transporter permease [Bombilactobacillus bombi]MBA1434734.1 ABC transporter permease [Bombilactobacillus bombi]